MVPVLRCHPCINPLWESTTFFITRFLSIFIYPGSLSFAKLVMMSSAPAKSVGGARCASQDPLIQSSWQSMLSHYYHLRPSLKRDKFCAKFYLSNVNGYVSLLTNETLAVMSWNWQRLWRHTSMFCSRAFKVFRFSVRAFGFCSTAGMTFLLVL